jgi:hypothetical protein
MVDPSSEAGGARGGEKLECALRAGRCLRGGRGLLRRKRVPLGGEWAEDLTEGDIIQPRIREVRERLEEVGRDISHH